MRRLFSVRAVAALVVSTISVATLLPAVISTPAAAGVITSCNLNGTALAFWETGTVTTLKTVTGGNASALASNGLLQGERMLYSNVTSLCGGLDAVVTTKTLSGGASVSTFDGGKAGATDDYFESDLTVNQDSNPATVSYVEFQFDFYLHGQIPAVDNSAIPAGVNPIVLNNVFVTGVDIDSRQFNAFTAADGYTISAGACSPPIVPNRGATLTDCSSRLAVDTYTVGTQTRASNWLNKADILASAADVSGSNYPQDMITVNFGVLNPGFVVRVGAYGDTGNTSAYYGIRFAPESWGAASSTSSTGYDGTSVALNYNGNGSTGGTNPSSVTRKTAETATVSVLGTLVRAGYTFTGWNTAANGSGTSYAAGSVFTFPATDTTLYAQWTADGSPAPDTYTVTYDGNGNGGGAAPTDGSSPYVADDTVTVLGNSGPLTRTGYHFTGWNTAANGSGTGYVAGGTFNIVANTTLYAQWALDELVVTYSPGTGTGTMSGGDTVTVNYGDTHTVKAPTGYSKPGYHFTGWLSTSTYATGDSVTITAPKTFTAQWAPDSYTLTTNTNGNGGVTSGGNFNYGETKTLTATPGPGWRFLGWSGDCEGSSNPLVVTVTSNMTCTANFGTDPIVTYKLTVSTIGDGTATPGTNWYNDGTKAVVTAKPAAGWIFTGWSGVCTGSATVCEVLMTMDKEVTATFVKAVTIKTNTPGGGKVNSSQPTITPLLPGTKVILTATPDEGWEFTGWSGSCTGTDNPLTVTLDESKECTANFKEKPKPEVEPDIKVKDDTYKTNPNTPLKLPAGASILKNDGSTITKVALATKTKHGTISLGSNGKLVYTPNKGFVGVDSFKYKAFDANGRSVIATVKIVVAPKTPTDIKTGR